MHFRLLFKSMQDELTGQGACIKVNEIFKYGEYYRNLID